MKKSLVAPIIVFVMVSCVFFVSDDSSAVEITYSNGDALFEYATYGNGNGSDPYRCTLLSVSDAQETLFIPAALDGHNVTEIAENAMSGLTGVKYIVVPKTVRTIGDSAFPLDVEAIYFLGDMPSGTIPESKINHSPNAAGWIVGNEFEILESTADDGSSVQGLEISGDAVIIGGKASADKCLTIPSSIDGIKVTSIGGYAFGAEDIGNNVKTHRTDLETVNVENGVEIIRERAFFYQGSLVTINIPDSMTVIMDEAFRSDKSLSNCVLPDSMTSIGFEAFRECKSLTRIVIPDSVTTLNDGSFRLCSGAESIIIGKGISEIPPNCFGYGSSLKDISFSGKIEKIGGYAFYFCKSLESFTVPDSVRIIGKAAFDGCDSLTELRFGDGLELIDSKAFNDCIGLIEIELPSSVKKVGDDAFWGCSSLTKVVLNSHPDLGSKAFPSETELEYREHDDDHSVIIIVVIVAIAAIMSVIYIIKRR